MKALTVLVLLCAALGIAACGGPVAPGDAPASPNPMIILNGTVVDGLGSEPIREGIVVIVEDRIAFVGRASDYPDRTNARVIDARGGTILPGIIDAHVHGAADPAVRRQFLTEGVTAVCDLGFPLEAMSQFEEDHLGQAAVARGFRAGPIITALGGLPDAAIQEHVNYEVATADEARAAVIDLFDRGVDVIKVYLEPEWGGVSFPMLNQEELTAIVDQAHSLGLLVRAHVSFASTLGMAVQAGVDTVEHVPVSVTRSDLQALSETQRHALFQGGDPLQVFLTDLYPQYESQLEEMVQAGIVIVPTLHSHEQAAEGSPEQNAAMEIILGIVDRFHAMGGTLALGSDFIAGAGMQAGMPLREMELLLEAGLSPMEVIEAGTRRAATVCGHGGELGTLEPGKLADVIVVEGDPLEDLQAMGHVVLVIRNGELAVATDGMVPAGEWPVDPTQQD